MVYDIGRFCLSIFTYYQNQVDHKGFLAYYYRREDWQDCQIKALVRKIRVVTFRSQQLARLTGSSILDSSWTVD